MFIQTTVTHYADAIFVIDDEFNFIDVNDVACENLGYTREELLGMGVLDIDAVVTKEQLDKLRETFHMREDSTELITTKHKTKSGQIIDVEVTTSLLTLGEKSYRISVAKDITHKKKSDHEHTLLQFAFEHNHESAFLISEAGEFLYVNQALCKFLQYSNEELLSKKVFDVNPNISADEWPQHWYTLKEIGALVFESTNQRKDGKIIPVEINTKYFEYEGRSYNIGIVKDITQSKAIQADLIQREQKFRSLANNLPDNIARLDLKGRFLYVNQVFLKTTGKLINEIIGKTISELFPDPKLIDIEKSIMEVIKNKKPYELKKLQHALEDGTIRYDDLSIVPEFDALGNIVSVLTIGRDMTAHYEMQNEIIKKEELYRFLAESIPANILLWDNDARYIYVNSLYAYKTVKMSPEALIGKTVDEAFPDGRFEKTKGIVDTVIRTKEKITLKKLSVNLDDPHELHDVQLIPHFDQNNNVQSVLGVGLDMSEHYHLQEEIEAKEEQLRLTVETLPGVVGILHLNLDGSPEIPYISPNVQELYGYSDQQIMKNARRLVSVIHPDDLKKVQHEMVRSLRNMSLWRQEYRIIHPKKKERWIELHAKPVTDPQGGTRWFGYMLDITERKQFEKQMGLVSIGQLSAGITHEINTPLTYIKGYIEMLRFDVENISNDATKNSITNSLDNMQDGIDRMTRIIESMRELAGKGKGIKEHVDIVQSFITTLIMVHNRAKYISKIYLNNELFTFDLKIDAEPFIAHVQRQRLEQVWIIILNNALDVLSQNKEFESARIDIFIDSVDQFIIIKVEDNAGGIKKDLLPTIFEPFTSTKEHGGMGLGLNIAKQIIDEQNGTIQAENGEKGAIFTITLPKLF